MEITLSLVVVGVCALVGWAWSGSTSRGSFDLGWLVVAFLAFLTASMAIDHGKLAKNEYFLIGTCVLPSFGVELLADCSLNNFLSRPNYGSLVLFAFLSACLVLLVLGMIIFVKLGIGIGDLSNADYRAIQGITQILGVIISVIIVLDTYKLLCVGSYSAIEREAMFEVQFRYISFAVYLFLVVKMMLPLLAKGLRETSRN